MRYVQNTLVIVGSVSLGAIVCGPMLTYVIAMIWPYTPRSGDMGFSFRDVMLIGILGLGIIVGGIVGLRRALTWISVREPEAWSRSIWLGIAFGIGAGLALRFSPMIAGRGGLFFELLQWWIGTAVLLAAMGQVGGMLGALAGASQQLRIKTAKKKKKRKHAQSRQ